MPILIKKLDSICLIFSKGFDLEKNPLETQLKN